MAALTKNAISSTGRVVQALAAAAAGGDTVAAFNASKDFLVIRNAHATLTRTVTFANQETDSHGHDTDYAITIAAVTTEHIELSLVAGGASRFKHPTTGLLEISYSDAAADITIGVFSRP